LEIRRNWDEDDDLCLPQNRIIAYMFIPGLGFYGIGLLNVLGNATKAVTAAWRLMLDAGMFSNFPGFLYLKSFAKQITNQFRIPPGAGQPIDTVGNDIRASVMPLPYKDPSAVFIQLIDNIAQTASRVGGIGEVQVGEGKQDAPVGTTLALLEQATKLMSAVHKRLHSAQAEEFELLKSLLMEDPEALWRHNKKSEVFRLMNERIPELAPIVAEQEQADTHRKQLFLAALADADLVPAADPNTSSQTERYLKIYALRQMAATNPQMDLKAVDTQAVTTLGFDNAQQFFVQQDPNAPPPPPPPEALMAQASVMAAQARMADSQTKMQESQVKLAAMQQDAQIKVQSEQSKDQIARLGVAREMVIHQADTRRDMAMQSSDQQHEMRMAALNHAVDLHKQHQEQATGVADKIHEHRQNMQQHAVEHHQGVVDRLHEHQQNVLAHRFEMQQAEQQHQHALQQAQQEHGHAIEQAEQAHGHAVEQIKATPKPKPASKERFRGGRVVADAASDLSEAADAVEADPNGGTGEAIASIIANTVRELRDSDARTRGATDGQIAQALRQVASTMAQLRREDVAASRSVNANTYAAINRLATKLEDIRDQSQPQTLAAVNRLTGALQELRSADKQHEPQTLAAITRLSNTLTQLQTADSSREPKTLEAINGLTKTLQDMRAHDAERDQATESAAREEQRISDARRGQEMRASEQRTLAAISQLTGALRELRAADSSRAEAEAGRAQASEERARASEERAQAAINQLSHVARELRSANNSNSEINSVTARFEESLRTVRSELSQNRSSDSQHVQALGSLERLIASMHDRQIGGPQPATDNAQLIEAMRHFVRVQTAPRTLIRDAQGRITGVRVEMPQENNADRRRSRCGTNDSCLSIRRS
jgi:hypothetical protein